MLKTYALSTATPPGTGAPNPSIHNRPFPTMPKLAALATANLFSKHGLNSTFHINRDVELVSFVSRKEQETRQAYCISIVALCAELCKASKLIRRRPSLHFLWHGACGIDVCEMNK